MSDKWRVQLGDRVRDRISGLVGIATCQGNYLYGCHRVSVAPEEAKDGKPAETQYFDEDQLDVIKSAAEVARERKQKPTGGPQRGDSKMERAGI